MKKFGIFYASSTGTTADIANRLAERLGVDSADVHDVAKVSPAKTGEYETILVGSSTWGAGDLQDDMYDFLDGAEALDLKGHKLAFFGCGDESMADTFCNAVGEMNRRLTQTGADIVGRFNADGYDFSDSSAKMADGQYAGLMLDEVNHPEFTDRRLDEWVKLVK